MRRRASDDDAPAAVRRPHRGFGRQPAGEQREPAILRARPLEQAGRALTAFAAALGTLAFSYAETPENYATVQDDAAYVGSKSCSGCHREIYDQYGKTPMGRSARPVDDAAQRPAAQGPAFQRTTVRHPLFNRRYEIFRDGESWLQSEYALDAAGKEIFRTTHELAYAIGSGTHGVSYLVRRGGQLFQAPISYYTATASWELSPGYEKQDLGFSRQIETSCIACHTGRPRFTEGKPGFYEDPAFEELAVGCENCHGPGQAHVAARIENPEPSTAVDFTIFDPSKAPARLGENVCMQCHQWGDARALLPGKNYFDFRPGARLADTLAILKVPLDRSGGGSVLLEHHFGMETSACFRGSEGRLSCFSCHEVHRPPAPSAKVSYYRGKCLPCHDNESCLLPLAQRTAVSPANDCAGCHMPRHALENIRHTALTNHRIPRRPDAPIPDAAFRAPTPGLHDLVMLNPPPGDTVALPLATRFRAYIEMASDRPEYRAKAFELLDELAAGDPDDPMALAGLGHAAKQEKTAEGDRRAMAYLTKAMERNSSVDSVYSDLAEVLNRSGRGMDALAIVDRGLEQTPFSRRLSRMRTFTLIQLQRFSEAERTVRRHVRLHPNDAEMRDLLRKIDAANAAP